MGVLSGVVAVSKRSGGSAMRLCGATGLAQPRLIGRLLRSMRHEHTRRHWKRKTWEVSVHEGARGVMRNSSHGCPDGCAKIYAYIDRNMGERKEEGDSQNQLRPGQLQSRFSQLIEEQAKASTFKKRTADDGLEVLTPAKKKQVQKAAGKARAKAKTKAKGKSKAMGKTRQRPVQVLKPQAAKRVKDMHIANSVGELALKKGVWRVGEVAKPHRDRERGTNR
jgi:hypothetical protein